MKGIYQHYKGGLYEVLHVAKHSETQEELVIYKSISDDQIWARPKPTFLESVMHSDLYIPRFKRL